MSDARTAPQAAASTLPPFATGLALAVALLLGFLSLELALDRFVLLDQDSYREDVRVALVLCLLAGYLPAAWLDSVRSAQRTALALEPLVEPGAGPAILEQVGHYDRRALGVASVCGIVALAFGMLVVDWHPNVVFAAGQMSPEAFFHRVLALFIGWFGGRASYVTVVESRRLSRVGREHLRVDLLDPGSASPLIRHGLRSALITIGALSLLSLMFYDFRAAPNLAWFLLLASALFLVLAATALLMPVRGVRDAIVRKKTQELARVNAEIRRAGEAGAGLADWVTYRGLIEEVREWPLDAPTLRRFALYLAIPLGSWFGGAFVERLVDKLLD